MASPHGTFVWYELMTTDASAAETFYKSVIGWNAQDAGHADYTLLSVGDTQVAGLMTLLTLKRLNVPLDRLSVEVTSTSMLRRSRALKPLLNNIASGCATATACSSPTRRPAGATRSC